MFEVSSNEMDFDNRDKIIIRLRIYPVSVNHLTRLARSFVLRFTHHVRIRLLVVVKRIRKAQSNYSFILVQYHLKTINRS